MKLPGRQVLIKILAASAISAWIVSANVLLRKLLFDMDGGSVAFLMFVFIILLAYWAGGHLLGEAPAFLKKAADFKTVRCLSFMLHIKDGARVSAAFAAWLIVLVPVLAAYFLFKQYGILRMLFEMLLVLFAYIIALKHSRKSPVQIFGKGMTYTGFVILAACLAIPLFMNKLTYLRPWFFAALYLFIFAYLIIRNQEDIDSNIFDSRHIEKSFLPKNLRRFNTLSVCVLFIIILLLFNLKSIVITLLELLGNLTVLIIKGILWLMKNMSGQEGVIEQSGTAAQSPNFFGGEASAISPFRNLLFNITKNFIILYLAYRIVLLVVKKLPGILRKAACWLKKLLSVGNNGADLGSMDYSDESELVKPIHERSLRRSLKKKLRKSRKGLGGISDPVEKIRFMYGAILHSLPLVGIQPEKSDTSMEIMEKTSSAGKLSKALHPFTGIYEQVRYGEIHPDTQMLSDAESHFKSVIDEIGIKQEGL